MAKRRQRPRVRDDGLTLSQKSRNSYAGEVRAIGVLAGHILAEQMRPQWELDNPGGTYHFSKVTWAAVHERCNGRIAVQTLRNLLEGYTRNPTSHTLHVVIDMIGEASLRQSLENAQTQLLGGTRRRQRRAA